MERQIPKNVRQIGNVSDTPKIYVEDYVDTFFYPTMRESRRNTNRCISCRRHAKDEGRRICLYIWGNSDA